jgi:hypothetical protein
MQESVATFAHLTGLTHATVGFEVSNAMANLSPGQRTIVEPVADRARMTKYVLASTKNLSHIPHVPSFAEIPRPPLLLGRLATIGRDLTALFGRAA